MTNMTQLPSREQMRTLIARQKGPQAFQTVKSKSPEDLEAYIKYSQKRILEEAERKGQWYVTRTYEEYTWRDIDKFSIEIPDDYYGDPADFYMTMPSSYEEGGLKVELRSLVTGRTEVHYAQHLLNHSTTLPPAEDIRVGWIFWTEGPNYQWAHYKD